jgi:hypothetical protein
VINFDPSVAGAGEINAIVHDEDLGIIVAGRFRTLSSGTVVHSITTFQSEQLSEALGNGCAFEQQRLLFISLPSNLSAY